MSLFLFSGFLGLTPPICGNEINPLGISVKLCYFWLYSNTIQTIPACMVSTIRKTSVIYTLFIFKFPAIPLLSRLFASIPKFNKLYRIVYHFPAKIVLTIIMVLWYYEIGFFVNLFKFRCILRKIRKC